MNKNELLKVKKAKNLSLSMEAIIELKRKASQVGKTESQYIEDYILGPDVQTEPVTITRFMTGEAQPALIDEDAIDQNVDIAAVYAHYMTTFDKDPRYKLTKDRENVIKARLKEGYTVEECKQHIDFIAASEFHNGSNDQGKVYNDLKDIIFNKTKFEKRVDEIKNSKPKTKELSDEELEKDYEQKMMDLPF